MFLMNFAGGIGSFVCTNDKHNRKRNAIIESDQTHLIRSGVRFKLCTVLLRAVALCTEINY